MRQVLFAPDTGSRASRALHGNPLAQAPHLLRATCSSPSLRHPAARRGPASLRNPSQAAWHRSSRTSLQGPLLLQPVAQQQREAQGSSGPLDTQETRSGEEAVPSEPGPDGKSAEAAALGVESTNGSAASHRAASSGSGDAEERRIPQGDAPVASTEAGSEREPFPLSVLLAVAKAIQGTRLVRFVANWPAWQQRKRLQQLQELADANPKDPAQQAKYLRELNRVRCGTWGPGVSSRPCSVLAGKPALLRLLPEASASPAVCMTG